MPAAQRVMVIGPNGGATVYKSIRAAGRVLSGTGTEGPRKQIADEVFSLFRPRNPVRNNWIEVTKHPGGIKRPSRWPARPSVVDVETGVLV